MSGMYEAFRSGSDQSSRSDEERASAPMSGALTNENRVMEVGASRDAPLNRNIYSHGSRFADMAGGLAHMARQADPVSRAALGFTDLIGLTGETDASRMMRLRGAAGSLADDDQRLAFYERELGPGNAAINNSGNLVIRDTDTGNWHYANPGLSSRQGLLSNIGSAVADLPYDLSSMQAEGLGGLIEAAATRGASLRSLSPRAANWARAGGATVGGAGIELLGRPLIQRMYGVSDLDDRGLGERSRAAMIDMAGAGISERVMPGLTQFASRRMGPLLESLYEKMPWRSVDKGRARDLDIDTIADSVSRDSSTNVGRQSGYADPSGPEGVLTMTELQALENAASFGGTRHLTPAAIGGQPAATDFGALVGYDFSGPGSQSLRGYAADYIHDQQNALRHLIPTLDSAINQFPARYTRPATDAYTGAISGFRREGEDLIDQIARPWREAIDRVPNNTAVPITESQARVIDDIFTDPSIMSNARAAERVAGGDAAKLNNLLRDMHSGNNPIYRPANEAGDPAVIDLYTLDAYMQELASLDLQSARMRQLRDDIQGRIRPLMTGVVGDRGFRDADIEAMYAAIAPIRRNISNTTQGLTEIGLTGQNSAVNLGTLDNAVFKSPNMDVLTAGGAVGVPSEMLGNIAGRSTAARMSNAPAFTRSTGMGQEDLEAANLLQQGLFGSRHPDIMFGRRLATDGSQEITPHSFSFSQRPESSVNIDTVLYQPDMVASRVGREGYDALAPTARRLASLGSTTHGRKNMGSYTNPSGSTNIAANHALATADASALSRLLVGGDLGAATATWMAKNVFQRGRRRRTENLISEAAGMDLAGRIAPTQNLRRLSNELFRNKQDVTGLGGKAAGAFDILTGGGSLARRADADALARRRIAEGQDALLGRYRQAPEIESNTMELLDTILQRPRGMFDQAAYNRIISDPMSLAKWKLMQSPINAMAGSAVESTGAFDDEEPGAYADGGRVENRNGVIPFTMGLVRNMFSPGGTMNPTGPIVEPSIEGLKQANQFAADSLNPTVGVEDAIGAFDEGRYLDALVDGGTALPIIGMSSAPARGAIRVSSRSDASDIFGPGTERVMYEDPNTGGFMEVLTRQNGPASTIELYVPEAARGQGGGKRLLEQAMSDNPRFMGQVSSRAAAKNAYTAGRRPLDNTDATLEDVYRIIDEYSSVNMLSPQEIAARSASDEGAIKPLLHQRSVRGR